MCGLFVMASCTRPLERGAFDRGLHALRRRGPDARRACVDRYAMLGHTRLAIVDIEGGHQPIDNEDGSAILVFNGELYGHAATRRDLEGRGHRFRTRCDAEIALHLYEDLGPEKMLAELRGEFAFVIWDARRKRIFAARDRFGIKPLLYLEAHGVLHLASNAHALFASLAVRPRWNPDALLHAMSMQYAPPDRTLFEGVHVLPPGHYLIADLERSSSPSVHRYWDLDYPPVAQPWSMPDATDALATALDEAVRVRLVADVPVAFQLSGGIDSSAVLGLGARALQSSGERAHAFTIAFDDGGAYDERSIAKEMAEHAGAELHLISVSADALLRELPDAVIDGEGLAVNAHIAAKRILARAVRDAGFKVVLTGEGADEVLAGYAHLRCDLDATRSQEVSLSNPLSAGLMMPSNHAEAMLDTSGVEDALGFVPTWLRAKAGLGGQLHQLLTPEARSRSRSLDAYRRLATRSLDQLRGRGRVEQASYLWSKLALEGYILRTLGDGMEMAASIEGRLPFLDHRLFELVRTFPTALKIHEGREKAVLREAVAPVITERLRTRPKHPFLAPPLLATTSPPALLFDVLAADNALPDCFDRASVRALLDRVRRAESSTGSTMTASERTSLEPVLMMLLSTSLLHSHFRLGA